MERAITASGRFEAFDSRNALLDLSTWHGVRRTWYEVLSETTDERRAEREALDTKCGVLLSRITRRDVAQVARRTNAELSSFTERTPHCCMAARVSTRMISSTRSTPGWPNAPKP